MHSTCNDNIFHEVNTNTALWALVQSDINTNVNAILPWLMYNVPTGIYKIVHNIFKIDPLPIWDIVKMSNNVWKDWQNFRLFDSDILSRHTTILSIKFCHQCRDLIVCSTCVYDWILSILFVSFFKTEQTLYFLYLISTLKIELKM